MQISIAGMHEITDLMDMIRLFYEEDHHDFQEVPIRKILEEILGEKSQGTIYLVRYHDEIAGYFILTFSWSLEYGGRNVFIDELYIKEKYRGLGLGKSCIEFVEQFAKDKKIKAIHLEVNKYNIAKKLYESKGYFSHNSDLMSKRL